MWKYVVDLVKALFGMGSGLRRERREDFVAVGIQWERIVARLEARLVIVESDLHKCESQHAAAEHRISELEEQLVKIGYINNIGQLRTPQKKLIQNRVISVLVVDDEPIMRKCIQVLMDAQAELEQIGVEYSEAGNGAECLEHLHRAQFDVLMLDLNMPKLNGFDVIKRMKKLAGNRPMIFVITGYFRHYPEIEALLASGDIAMVLEKPMDKAAMVEVFEKIKERL